MTIETELKSRHEAEPPSFRACFEELVRRYQSEIDLAALGPNAELALEVSFACARGSQHWFTQPLTWGVLQKLFEAEIETRAKDSIIFCAGPLTGGKADNGTRKVKEHVEGLDLVVLDFDKGDAPLDKLAARLTALGLEGAAYATFSHLKAETSLAWSVTRPNAKTGEIETRATAFQDFTRAQFGIAGHAPLEPAQVTPEIFNAFMVEEQGFDADKLGAVTILQFDKVEKTRVKAQDETWQTHETCNVVAKHNPLCKSRLALPLGRRFARQPGETKASFQTRWQEEVYDPVARLIGFRFDRVCASTERGHYAMTRKAGQAPVPLCHTRGRLLDIDDPEIQKLLAPFKGAPEGDKEQHAKAKRSKSCSPDRSACSDDWRGFKAADAAASLLPSVTDKRADESNPLVAFSCPFVHEHATTNNPSAHQCYAYNAAAADKLPTVKCQADTCCDRPYDEFLDALFDETVKADPAYWVIEEFGRSGVYIPERELDAKLREINETWAVVRLGNRVRYLHETVEDDLELYDAKSLANWFSNWFYYWVDAKGNAHEALIISAWLKWQYRRQYRGLRFCPQPEGAPEGVYNSYYGFTVEPKPGSWKRLLGHIYRNVCGREPRYFRFFIAWLAQLVQQPHIKPGTNIAMKGKEGVGKSKVGEWVVALFGRNAIVVSESERITGRFNAHLENKLFLMAEEAFWAGDKSAEGKLKDLATGMNMSYERKGLDPYEGKNYTRIMIASNEDWIVPASSGGRRWFVLEVGEEHEKDFDYFAAIDEEMENGGLAAMLFDLKRTKLPRQVNVRDAPVTQELVDQRLHSYDNKRRWWRGVLLEGGFRDNASDTFIALKEDTCTVVRRDDVFAGARPYFLGPKGVDPTPSEVGKFMAKMLGELQETRPTIESKRQWCHIFPPLQEMRHKWLEATGEKIQAGQVMQPSDVGSAEIAEKVFIESATSAEKFAFDAIAATAALGVTDDDELTAAAERAVADSRRGWQQQIATAAGKAHH